MNALIFAKRIYSKLTGTNFKLSFSQSGEDCIILFLIHSLKLVKIQYLDIGTNNPRNMNNTYLLYLLGYRGICVEPDPTFHAQIKKHRREDLLIPAGISIENQLEADFFIMDDSILNTFSEQEAEKMMRLHNRTIKKKITVPLVSINEVLENHFDKNSHMIISLDVEGLDLIVLESLNFSKYRPSIICVETLSFSNNLTGAKDLTVSELLRLKEYTLFADTYINSIFVDNRLLQRE